MWAVFTEHHPPLRPSTQSKTSNLKEKKLYFFPSLFSLKRDRQRLFIASLYGWLTVNGAIRAFIAWTD
jgi:hypothetical protein